MQNPNRPSVNFNPPNQLQIYPSNLYPNYIHNVQVRSTFSHHQPRTIEISPLDNKFSISHNDPNYQRKKSFPLNQITFSYTTPDKNGNNYLNIDTNTGKKYTLKAQNQSQFTHDINKAQQYQQINQLQEQQVPFIPLPKQVNYLTPLQAGLNMNVQRIVTPSYNATQTTSNVNQPERVKKLQPEHIHELKNYPRRKYFINPEDWKLDEKKGGLIFINEDKKKNQSKILKFIVKKFLSTGSFMGISFPTFAMKSEGILQTYAKACGTAPILFENVTNSVQRMKKFICFIHTFSIIFADMQKPFNPVLGQTFQAKVADGNFTAQQISHHPPISSFLYEGENYKISGSMQLTANIGPNSATGLFLGDLKIQFSDGTWIKGKLLSGEFSGFMIGERKFETYGSVYVYDNKKIVCSFSTKQKNNNHFEGFIGKLTPQHNEEFLMRVQSSDRFHKFPFYDRKCFQVVYSSVQIVYNSHTSFDGKEYLNLHQGKFLPFLPEPLHKNQILLLSDSRFRKDIELLKQNKLEQAQHQKQRIQQIERLSRKLRAKYDPWHHQSA